MLMSSIKTESIVDSVSSELVLDEIDIKIEPQGDYMEKNILKNEPFVSEIINIPDDVTTGSKTVTKMESIADSLSSELILDVINIKIEPQGDFMENTIHKNEPFVSENISIPDDVMGIKTDDFELSNYLVGNPPKMLIVKLQPIVIGKCDNCHVQFYYVPKKGVDSGKTDIKCGLCDNQFIALNILGHRSWFNNEISERYDSTKSFLIGGDIPSHCIETTLISYGIDRTQPVFNSGFNKKAKDDDIFYASQDIEESYQCNLCDNRFTKEDDLVIHKKYHAGIKPFQCNVCFKTFSLKSYLTKHNLRIHIDTDRVRCKICFKLFHFESKLQEHMNTHFIEKQFECHLCDRKYYSKSNLNRHMKYHSGVKPYKCELCCKMFFVPEDLKKHIRTHTELKPIKCAVCDKIFDDESLLQEHKQCHEKAKPYECEVCPKSFKIKKNLHLHLRCHSEEQPFECDICGKSYYIKQCLRRHIRSHTVQEKSYKCVICKKAYALESHLEKHKKRHYGNEKFGCDLNDEKISTLVNQYKKTKAKVLPFQCNICKKKFRKKANYTNHLKIHTDVRPFQCDLCKGKKGFVTERDLIRHLVTHTKDKPFKCNICGKTFAAKTSHEYHMLRHAGEKPNKCDICDKKFTTKAELTAHWKYHTGENLFKCHICDKKFIKNYDCQRHIKTHSGEKPFKCDLCETRFTTKSAQINHYKKKHPAE